MYSVNSQLPPLLFSASAVMSKMIKWVHFMFTT